MNPTALTFRLGEDLIQSLPESQSTVSNSQLQEQEEEHERIRSVLDEYKIRLKRGTLNVSQPLTNELKSWFSSHITELDKEYGSYQK
jgi:hemerythrin